MKKNITLTEAQLQMAINESVRRIIEEAINWDSIKSMNPLRAYRDNVSGGQRNFTQSGQKRFGADGGEGYQAKPYTMGDTYQRDGETGPGEEYMNHMNKVQSGELNPSQVQSNGSQYTNQLQQKSAILDDLIGKLKQYMQNGWFGNSQQAISLWNGMKGACDVAKGQINSEIKRISKGGQQQRQVAESKVGEWLYGKAKNLGMFNPMAVSKTNKYGYDTSSGEGDWIVDLRNEIQNAIKLGCWSGGAASKCLHQVQNFANTLDISHRMKVPVAAAIGAIAAGSVFGGVGGAGNPSMQPNQGGQPVQTTQMAPQTGQVNFATGSDEISPEDSTNIANAAKQGQTITINPQYSAVGGQYANMRNGATQNGTLATDRGNHVARIAQGANPNIQTQVGQGQLGGQQANWTVQEGRLSQRTLNRIINESINKVLRG